MNRAEEFNVDDVVEAHSLKITTKYNGMQGTIIEPLQYISARCILTSADLSGYRYTIHFADGLTTTVAPENLRKPPEEFDQSTAQEFAQLMQRLTRPFAFEKAGRA